MNRPQKKDETLPQDWHTADIKAALEKAGWSLRKLSLHHGYIGTTLSAALRRPYPNAERLIAAAIGVKPESIWPSRYDHRRPFRGIGGYPSHNKLAKGKFTTPSKARNVNREAVV